MADAVQARIHTGFHRFTEIGQIFQNYSEFSKGGIKKSITFPKGTRLWTPLEGTRCFGNQPPFIDLYLGSAPAVKSIYCRTKLLTKNLLKYRWIVVLKIKPSQDSLLSGQGTDRAYCSLTSISWFHHSGSQKGQTFVSPSFIHHTKDKKMLLSKWMKSRSIAVIVIWSSQLSSLTLFYPSATILSLTRVFA